MQFCTCPARACFLAEVRHVHLRNTAAPATQVHPQQHLPKRRAHAAATPSKHEQRKARPLTGAVGPEHKHAVHHRHLGHLQGTGSPSRTHGWAPGAERHTAVARRSPAACRPGGSLQQRPASCTPPTPRAHLQAQLLQPLVEGALKVGVAAGLRRSRGGGAAAASTAAPKCRTAVQPLPPAPAGKDSALCTAACASMPATQDRCCPAEHPPPTCHATLGAAVALLPLS